VSMSQASIAPSQATTIKMANPSSSRDRHRRAILSWNRRLRRRQAALQTERATPAATTISRAGLSPSLPQLQPARPPAEPPPPPIHSDFGMTGSTNPDINATTINYPADISDDDSIFGIPPLALRHDSSSDDESSPPLIRRVDSSSDDESTSQPSTQPTCLSSTPNSFSSACSRLWPDDNSISSESSYSVSALGPPPPGSIMDFWDRPIPTSALHDFPSPFEDAKCRSFSVDYDSDE
jgi:hypothetical protein